MRHIGALSSMACLVVYNIKKPESYEKEKVDYRDADAGNGLGLHGAGQCVGQQYLGWASFEGSRRQFGALFRKFRHPERVFKFYGCRCQCRRHYMVL